MTELKDMLIEVSPGLQTYMEKRKIIPCAYILFEEEIYIRLNETIYISTKPPYRTEYAAILCAVCGANNLYSSQQLFDVLPGWVSDYILKVWGHNWGYNRGMDRTNLVLLGVGYTRKEYDLLSIIPKTLKQYFPNWLQINKALAEYCFEQGLMED